MTRPINWSLIEEQYETMAKIAVAIAERGVSPTTVLRRFNTYSRRNSTYRGIVELGKVAKTNFLCEYLSSPDLRREIQQGLNKVEAWNSLSTFICYGKAGQVTEHQISDQVQSIACLQLVQNCLILWNTLMMDRLLEKKESILQDVEQLRHLSPLLHHHVNPYGKFEIDLRGTGLLTGVE
jgi:TnpA family transposase